MYQLDILESIYHKKGYIEKIIGRDIGLIASKLIKNNEKII